MDTVELMRTFVAVVKQQSFTAAGHALGKSKALVSKHIGELEERLGARLLNRTTRRVSVTEAGRAYYDRASALIAEIESLEESVKSVSGLPRGTLKITAPQALGELELMELVTGFRARYPDIAFDIFLSDRIVDLVGEGFDLALRISEAPDSSLIARKLCEMRVVVCAAPSYLARHPVPVVPEDIADHACIVDTNFQGRDTWRFRRGDERVTVRAGGTITANSAVAVRQALLAGLGVGLCPEFVVARDIRAGRLVELLADHGDLALTVHIVYPHRLYLSAKVRAFIDFAAEWYAVGAPWLAERPGFGAAQPAHAAQGSAR